MEFRFQSFRISKPDVKPRHAKPYPIPFFYKKNDKDELDRFIAWKILRKVNRSEWQAPMFTISKPDGSLRSLGDLRELNKRIKRKLFPIPKIHKASQAVNQIFSKQKIMELMQDFEFC